MRRAASANGLPRLPAFSWRFVTLYSAVQILYLATWIHLLIFIDSTHYSFEHVIHVAPHVYLWSSIILLCKTESKLPSYDLKLKICAIHWTFVILKGKLGGLMISSHPVQAIQPTSHMQCSPSHIRRNPCTR